MVKHLFLRSWSYVTPIGHWQGKVESEADLAGMSGWQNFAKWKEMYHSGAEEAAIRSTLPFRRIGFADIGKTRVKGKKRSRPEKKITGTIWHNRWNQEDVHASSLTQRGSWEYCRKRFGCRNEWNYAQKQQNNGISELNLSYIRKVPTERRLFDEDMLTWKGYRMAVQR